MFCPKCGAQNLDDAKFCRACGADIRLVPQALTGRLGGDVDDDADDTGEFDAEGRSRVERGTKKLVRGLCFLALFVASLFFARGVFFWATFWFIFPAIASISSGVGLLAQHAWRHSGQLPGGIKNTSRLGAGATTALPKFRLNEVAPADTAEIAAPPTSVTEGTTRHLDAVARED
jgi:zinc-ribbon domain